MEIPSSAAMLPVLAMNFIILWVYICNSMMPASLHMPVLEPLHDLPIKLGIPYHALDLSWVALPLQVSFGSMGIDPISGAPKNSHRLLTRASGVSGSWPRLDIQILIFFPGGTFVPSVGGYAGS